MKRRIMITSIPCFSQVDVMPLPFYERPSLVPVSTNQKKSEENFHFHKKAKSKNSVQGLFCSEPLQRHHRPQEMRVVSPDSFPKNYILSVSTSSCHSFELCLWASVFYLDLLCESFSKMWPKVSEKPKRGYFLGLEMVKKYFINGNCFFALLHCGLRKLL